MISINTYEDKIIKDRKSIFLAGPTPREANVKSWRPEALKILEKLNFNGVVYIPEFKQFTKVANDMETVDKLFSWEREALKEATVILFWIPRSFPDIPAFTTNVEFGYWLHTNKIIYGRPDNAEHIIYLDWLYKVDYNKKPVASLEELLKLAVEYCDEKSMGSTYGFKQ